MSSFWRNAAWRFALHTTMLAAFPPWAWSQTLSKSDRDFAQSMLQNVAEDVEKHYYDPKLHGVDWDARIQEAKKNIAAADSMGSAISEVAAVLDTLKDSHTAFIPPPRTNIHDYGFRLAMVGDRCLITRVVPGSDAEKKGLKLGDRILAVDDHPVTRKTLERISYIYDELRPQPGLLLTVGEDANRQHKVEVAASYRDSSIIHYYLQQGINQRVRDVREEGHLLRARYFEKGDSILVVKIPEFAFSADEVDNILGKMRSHKGVVFDLRHNPGGYTETLDRLLGGLFQNDLKIYDRVARNSTKSVSVPGRHHDAYAGRLAVLIDSASASASELFARVIQLQKRGFVVGDHSSGSVMEAESYSHAIAVDARAYYYAVVTDADLVMTDGKTLEHIGVEPDILILPTPQDLATQRDPALSKAVALVGGQLTPEEAGTILPLEESQLAGTFLTAH